MPAIRPRATAVTPVAEDTRSVMLKNKDGGLIRQDSLHGIKSTQGDIEIEDFDAE